MPSPKEIIQIKLSDETIADPGIIEFLIHTGRAPSFFPTTSRGHQPTTMVTVPPPGTQFGDTREQTGFIGVEKYRSPNGQSHGFAQTYEVSALVGEQLRRRARIALRELDRQTKPLPFWERWTNL